MKCVTVCYNADLTEVIVCVSDAHKRGFVLSLDRSLRYCASLNGRCRAVETLMVCGDYSHAGMMSPPGCAFIFITCPPKFTYIHTGLLALC